MQDHKAWAVVRHLRKKIEEVEESLKDGPERQKQLQHALEQKEQELRELEARSAQLVCCSFMRSASSLIAFHTTKDPKNC